MAAFFLPDALQPVFDRIAPAVLGDHADHSPEAQGKDVFLRHGPLQKEQLAELKRTGDEHSESDDEQPEYKACGSVVRREDSLRQQEGQWNQQQEIGGPVCG